MVNLTTNYLGINLKNPLIAGSSGLTDTVSNILDLEKQGAGAVVLKSLFEEEILLEMEGRLQKMASNGDIYPETLEFYENEDTEKESTLQYLDLIREAKEKVQIPVIASINCMTSSQWTYFPKQIEAAGADALELNIFVLPSDFDKSPEENESVYFDILKEIKKQVTIPVALKVSYYFSSLASSLKKFSEAGADGLVLFNRFYSPDFDLDKMEVTSSHILSSPADLPISLRWISIMSGRVNCDLAASTGVHDGEALIKQILAGANAVQVVSTLYRNGSGQIGNMLQTLTSWMEEKGYSSLEEFRGKMAQKASSNPAAIERVQFMKYFRGYHPAG